MKQIFDDIRKEIDIHSDEACFIPDDMLVIPSSWMLKKLDEAEAKWEAECCEWKVLHEKCFIQNPHTKRMFSNEPSMRNVYCNTCGKPIKISEVE